MKIAISLFILSACGLSAAPLLTYSFSGTASGNVGATSFTGASLLVTATADAASVVCDAGTCYFLMAPGVASFTISGVGTGNFNGPTNFYILQTASKAGFGDTTPRPSCCDIIQLVDPVLNTYALDTPIGPIGPAAVNPSVSAWNGLTTSLGAFTVTSMTNYSFEVTSATASAVPEPSTCALMAAGVALLLRRARRG